jgi:hypothetical protein
LSVGLEIHDRTDLLLPTTVCDGRRVDAILFLS